MNKVSITKISDIPKRAIESFEVIAGIMKNTGSVRKINNNK
tara:strand:- start:1226 stop:1348 length:123 start_codon:yes stop_codon:yes gene_type:complete